MTFGPKQPDETAVTVIHGEPTHSLVTWRLHTANGALHNRQLTRRLWPARGGWSGLLTTAATRVVLQAKE